MKKSVWIHTTPLSLAAKCLRIASFSQEPIDEASTQFSVEIPLSDVDKIIAGLQSIKETIEAEG